MPRFLTPFKASLLALALLYTEDQIPTSECVKLLGFLMSHILPDSQHALAEGELIVDHGSSLSSFEATLSSLESVMPGRSIYDLLLKKLWSVDCSDALDNLIKNLPALLSRSREQIQREKEAGVYAEGQSPGILRTSPLGAFIRRCHLEYTRLQFQDSIALWQEFIAFRARTRPAYEKKNASAGLNTLDMNLSDLQIDASHPLTQILYRGLIDRDDDFQSGFSVHDTEKLMEFQVSEMQRLGGRLPETMRLKLEHMSRGATFVPKVAHYLKFLDAWRAGDYTSAFDNLHRYFDYSMQNRDRVFYQYALLNLAILQADFGCYTEAIPAMQEAIATARENKDTTCLNYCMSWLYHFGRAFPSEMKSIRDSGILGSDSEGLAFLKSRAKDAEMWTLLSTSSLAEAKLGLQHGESLASIFESITKASHINVTKATQNITGPTLIMRGATFSRIGLTHLAWTCGETFLECYGKEAPIEDVLKCTCRMASVLIAQGRYREANDTMESMPAHVLRVLKYNNYAVFHSSLLRLQRLIHRSNISAAERIATQLHGQGPPDLDSSCVLELLKVEISLSRSNTSQALSQIEIIADKIATGHTDVLHLAQLLNLKARTLIQAKHPLKSFSIVVRAAQIAYRARILPCLWESIGLLSTILTSLREFSAAADILQSIIAQVLECEDSSLAARTYSYLADAHMGLAGCEAAKSTRRKEYMNKAMEDLDSAQAHFRRLENLQGQLDVLNKKATVMYWRGDLVLASDAASQYLELKRDYEDIDEW
jgi:anaphase-promoting complex subunit 5